MGSNDPTGTQDAYNSAVQNGQLRQQLQAIGLDLVGQPSVTVGSQPHSALTHLSWALCCSHRCLSFALTLTLCIGKWLAIVCCCSTNSASQQRPLNRILSGNHSADCTRRPLGNCIGSSHCILLLGKSTTHCCFLLKSRHPMTPKHDKHLNQAFWCLVIENPNLCGSYFPSPMHESLILLESSVS